METQNKRNYRELEERTLEFSKKIIPHGKRIKKDVVNSEIIKQVIRSDCSIGANYIEANEALSKKDRSHRLRISRKEAKETGYWLDILKETSVENIEEVSALQDETRELRNILSAVIDKTK